MQGLLDYFHTSGQVKTVQIGKGREIFEQAVFEWQPHQLTWTISAAVQGAAIRVNGRMAARRVPLDHLDEIIIGRTRARFLRMPDAPRLRGKPCREVMLGARRLLIGKDDPAAPATASSGQDYWLLDPEDDPRTARVHVEIVPARAGGFLIHDRSPTGTLLNGANFAEKQLVLGDRFIIGSHTFEFTGSSICCVDSLLGARVESHDLGLAVPHEGRMKTILRQVFIEIQAGEFIGILGGSGQGKSTLMNLLAGLLLPTRGSVLIDGETIGPRLLAGSVIGLVPQDDIVHAELTVRQALTLTARLRLAVSAQAMDSLVTGVITKLGLAEHAHKPVRILSGGQRKRVNIATELLVRPAVLFLDEPTSGLDPENEKDVFEALQNLSLTGQTVICTTHSLHKAFLFKRIAFVHDGRLLFAGTQDEAREHFLPLRKDASASEVAGNASIGLDRIYEVVKDGRKSSEQWQAQFLRSPLAPFSPEACPPPRRVFTRPPRQARPGFTASLAVLMRTQWSILTADRKNGLSLVLQAAGIGLLAGWVGRDDPEFRFFACLIATLWFGCSNAAQNIVRELPIFRRERIAGLSLHPYILGKTVFLAGISWAQILMLLAAQAMPVLIFGQTGTPARDVLPAGGLPLFALAYLLMGVVGVQIGLALSSLARTTTQATLWVPLALIPQILFSGFVVTRPEMPDTARHFSHIVPSAAAQHLVDLACVHGKPIPAMSDETEVPVFFWTDETGRPRLVSGRHSSRRGARDGADRIYKELDEYNTAWQNTLVDPASIGLHVPPQTEAHAPGEKPGGEKPENFVRRRPDILPDQKTGMEFRAYFSALPPLLGLGLWTVLCYLITLLGLSLAQPAPLRPSWLQKLKGNRD